MCVNVYGIFIMYCCWFVVVDMCPPMTETQISIAVVTDYAVPERELNDVAWWSGLQLTL